MRVARSPGLLFIHVPKTGGTTVNHVLEDLVPGIEIHNQRKHQTLADALADDPTRADLFTFGFVRNPWARMVSWWSMIHQGAERAADGDANARKHLKLRLWQLTLGCADFEEFVQTIPPRVERVRRPQIEYLTANGRQTDYIGRTETFDADLRQVLVRLRLPMPEFHRWNESPHGDYREYYTDQSRRRVEELFESDIRAFSYEF